MCGRFTLTDPIRLRRQFPQYAFEEFSEYGLPRFNVAPTQPVLGVLNDQSARVRQLSWGIGQRINARMETISAHPLSHRCIIFADGFYEWRARKPVYFTLEGRTSFAFAGIYQLQLGHEPSCAIITCPPNDLVATVHDRMPVILHDHVLDAWLKPDSVDVAFMRELLVPYPAEAMRSQPASQRLNNARYDAADVLVDDDPVQGSLF
jgi:putative SOS response-associated peptidase YedK